MALRLLNPAAGPLDTDGTLLPQVLLDREPLFILLVALLAARTVNLFVESAIAPAPSARSRPRTTPRAQAPRPLASLDLPSACRKLTGMPLPEPEPVVQEPATPGPDPNAEPVQERPAGEAAGHAGVARDKHWSFASIQDMDNQRSRRTWSATGSRAPRC